MHLLSSVDVSILSPENDFVILGNTGKYSILIHFFYFFNFYSVCKGCFIQDNFNFDMVSKFDHCRPP